MRKGGKEGTPREREKHLSLDLLSLFFFPLSEVSVLMLAFSFKIVRCTPKKVCASSYFLADLPSFFFSSL
jgi:hypothetical protein